MNDDPIILLEQPRGAGEVLRVILSDYKGRRYADIRVWYTDQAGKVRPGKAGVTLRAEALPDVLAALGQARTLLEDEHAQ